MPKRLVTGLLLIIFFLNNDVRCIAQEKSGQPPLVIKPSLTHSLIDSIREAMNRNYIFPDIAQKMLANVDNKFKAGAYNKINDPRELAKYLEQDLRKVYNDRHLSIRYDPRLARDLTDTTGRSKRNNEGAAEALKNEQAANFGFNKTEILPGNIGYLQLHQFSGFTRETQPTATAAFRFLSHTNALIIDLRKNGGGSPWTVSLMESYFFPQKTHMNDIVDRLQKDTIRMWTDPEDAEGIILHTPLYILTSRRTFSGAEDFSYGMQTVKRAIIVGDTTGGGAHPVRPLAIGHDFIAWVPFARSLNPYTKTDWEGTGVIPDIPVASDQALDAAVKSIFTQRIEHATSDQEKRKLQWQLNDLTARQSLQTRDSASITPFIGTYQGGLFFYIRGNILYCKNAERNNEIFKLLPVSGDTYVLDENVHVEFKKDESGKVTGIKMLWSNGGESYKPRDTSKPQFGMRD